MVNSVMFHDYHIDLNAMGLFHLISERDLDDSSIEAMVDAVKHLSYQYNRFVLKCVESIGSLDMLVGAGISFAPAYGDLYLVNVPDYIGHGINISQTFLISHVLYLKCLTELEAEGQQRFLIEDIIKEVHEREGLLYGVVIYSDD